MGTDITDRFTIGGLEPGRGMGARILHMTGAIRIAAEESDNVYTVDSDGTVAKTAGTSNVAGDFACTAGAGIVKLTALDFDDVLIKCNLEFIFGNSTTVSTNEMQIQAASGSFSLKVAGVAATQAPAGATGPLLGSGMDTMCVGSLAKMTGNSVSFNITTVEAEDAADYDLIVGNLITFSVIAIAIPA